MDWRLINLQSHVDTLIHLEENKMNVLRAESETGKSVFSKCLKFLLLGSSYLGRDYRKYLLRDGCEEGKCIIDMDGHKFGFRITKTYEVFFLDGKEWMQTYPPDEILDIMKAVVADGVILNVIDKHSEEFLLSESPTKNGRIVAEALSSPVLKTLDGELQQQLIDLAEVEKESKTEANIYRREADKLYYIDIFKLQQRCQKADELLKVIKIKDKALDLLKTFNKKYKYGIPNDNKIRKCIELDILRNFIKSFDYSVQIKYTKFVEYQMLNNFRNKYKYGFRELSLDADNINAKVKAINILQKLSDEIYEMDMLKDELEGEKICPYCGQIIDYEEI